MIPSFRYHLVDHPDGRQTVAVYSASEIAALFNDEEIARLGIGLPVIHQGQRHTDMQAFLMARRPQAASPAPGPFDALRAALRQRMRALRSPGEIAGVS